MPECTCCAVHNRGAHRTGELIAPGDHITPPAPPGLVKATSALDKAGKREVEAREAWSTAESARRQFEAQLMTKWGNHPRGIKAASPAEHAELDRLVDVAATLRQTYRETGQETVDARQRVGVEQHKATQVMIANW